MCLMWENKQPVGMKPDDQRDSTALHYVAFHGHAELAKLLIDHGADLSAMGDEKNRDLRPKTQTHPQYPA